MHTSITYLNNLIFPLIPESKCFGFKRMMLKLAGAKVGKNVKISSSLKVYGAGDLIIGNNTWVGYQTVIACSSRVEIGSNVDIAPRVYIGTGTHTIDIKSERIAAKDVSKDVCIGNGCWICANATILPGVTIGNKCIVAAGSIVNETIQGDLLLIAGIPAKIKKCYDNK